MGLTLIKDTSYEKKKNFWENVSTISMIVHNKIWKDTEYSIQR